ncbi:alpha-2-HS-glycoprotein-like [Pungitius pungitius]|uniref:alpha-2-HS-glycoprotein-like n=1 Tax=Pungitius pungitius TaxID=134920 RepID=UPI002E11C8E6
MNFLTTTLILGLVAGLWAQINVIRPKCDSVEAEEAALVAQDYLNAQHTHGYKYVLNRIEDIKIHTKPDGDIYVMEVDLLETDCHVLDPTPLANCTVRPKILTAIEGDCDVVLKKVGGVLTVIAFKCKTDESTEDLCLGCATLLPLNHTAALEFVQASLATFNNMTVNVTYAVKEVGRMSSQVVSRGAIYFAEYVVAEANCTKDVCTPLHDSVAVRGFCTARGLSTDHTVDCKMFPTLMPVDAKTVVDSNTTAADSNSTAAMPSVVHIHLSSQSPKHGLKHHQLTALHNPQQSDFLSAESAESVERVTLASTVAAAHPSLDSIAGSSSDSSASAEVPVLMFKRDLPAATISSVIDTTATHTDPIVPVPVCPGRVRFF